MTDTSKFATYEELIAEVKADGNIPACFIMSHETLWMVKKTGGIIDAEGLILGLPISINNTLELAYIGIGAGDADGNPIIAGRAS